MAVHGQSVKMGHEGPIILQNAAVAIGNGTEVQCEDAAYVVAQIAGITTATITWEISHNDLNWVSVIALNMTDGVSSTTATANGIFVVPVAGTQRMRARISAYTSGTITVTGSAYSGTVPVVLTSTAPAALGGGTEAAALRVTIANDSTGLLSVDDNGGTLTVDVGTALPAGTNNIGDVDVLTLPALPAGTNNIGDVDVLTLPALPAGTNNIGDVDVLSVPTPLNVTGGGVELGTLRVTIASDTTGVLSVDDNAGSLTIDNAALSVVGTGLEATALRVTIASDSTGLVSVDDNGGTLTIDNATLSVVGSGVEATALRVTLASDSTGVLSVDDNAGSLTVDNAALSVVGGGLEATALRVTLANDSTGLVSVDDNGGTLTIDNAALSVVGTGLEATALRVTLASDSTGLLSVDDNGGSLTVDVGTALPAGDNNIGNVDVLSIVPGTGATSLGKAEDAAHVSGDVGVLTLAVRQAATAPLSGLDGDYEPLQTDANGHLKVNVSDAIPAGTNNIGDVDIVTVPAPLNVVGTGTEAAALRVTVATDSTGVLSVDDNGGTLTVDVGTALPAGTNNIGDVDVLTVPAPLNVTGGGVELGALRVTIANDSTGVLSIDDNAGSLTVDNAALAVVGGGVEATALRVTIASDSTGLVSVDDNGSTLSVDDGAGSLTIDNATLSVVGSGLEATALRVTIASDSTGVLSVDDNGASLTVDVGTALPAGTNNIGDVDVLTIAAGDNNIGNVDIVTMPEVSPAASATVTGLSTYFAAALGAVATAVKASAGRLYALEISNINNVDVYVQIFDVAAAGVTLGTTTPKLSFLVPKGNATDRGSKDMVWTVPITFATAITIAITTTATGAVGPGTGAVVNILYI